MNPRSESPQTRSESPYIQTYFPCLGPSLPSLRRVSVHAATQALPGLPYGLWSMVYGPCRTCPAVAAAGTEALVAPHAAVAPLRVRLHLCMSAGGSSESDTACTASARSTVTVARWHAADAVPHVKAQPAESSCQPFD